VYSKVVVKILAMREYCVYKTEFGRRFRAGTSITGGDEVNTCCRISLHILLQFPQISPLIFMEISCSCV